MPIFSRSVHCRIYYWTLALLLVSLPLSRAGISIGLVILALNWLIEGNFQEKVPILIKNKSLWSVYLFFLVYAVWMIGTTNFSRGLYEVQIQFYLVLIAAVIATSNTLKRPQIILLMTLFVAAVAVSCLVSTYNIIIYQGLLINGMDKISPFITHIRLAILVDTAFFISIWLGKVAKKKYQRFGYILFAGYFVIFLFVIQSLTGIVILVLTAVFILFYKGFTRLSFMGRWFSIVGALLILLVSAQFVVHSYARFHKFDIVDTAHLDNTTIHGNPYKHDIASRAVENGHYIYLYICEREMAESWNKRSSINFHFKCKNGFELKDVLTRYLTSKGLRKDAVGVSKLTDDDVRNIENGLTNYIFANKYNPYARLYTALWELYIYQEGSNPSGGSLSQRIEYVSTAKRIIQSKPWFGTGTGDLELAFAEQYKEDDSALKQLYRKSSHNQFLSFLISFGIVGTSLLLFALIYPVVRSKNRSHYLMVCFLSIIVLSMFSIDLLEKHQGIGFFAIFYALFLFSDLRHEGSDNNL
jgi:hypothetical protein